MPYARAGNGPAAGRELGPRRLKEMESLAHVVLADPRAAPPSEPGWLIEISGTARLCNRTCAPVMPPPDCAYLPKPPSHSWTHDVCGRVVASKEP
jgi:hypothetical protein